MGNRYAIGYTLSRTPPNAEVASIEEWFSVFRHDVLDDGEIISRGRTIPRSKVIPVPCSEVTTSTSTGTADQDIYRNDKRDSDEADRAAAF